VKRRGAYAHVTYTGDIIVSGIRASNHVKIITIVATQRTLQK
jgi:hypothetical protein